MKKIKMSLRNSLFPSLFCLLLAGGVLVNAKQSFAQPGASNKKLTRTETTVTETDTPVPGCTTYTSYVEITCPEGTSTCTPQAKTVLRGPTQVCD